MKVPSIDWLIIDITWFCPGASVILAELAMEAGLPDGVLNIVHGTNVGYLYIFLLLLKISYLLVW